MIRGHAAKAVLDLAAGAGNFAKAALLERVPYNAFTLTECHSKRLEVVLTQFLVDEMRKEEGSTHFRPKAVQDQERQETDSVQDRKKRTKGGKKDEGSEVVPKKKAKAKAKNKKDDDDEEKNEEQEAEEEEAGGSPLPW